MRRRFDDMYHEPRRGFPDDREYGGFSDMRRGYMDDFDGRRSFGGGFSEGRRSMGFPEDRRMGFSGFRPRDYGGPPERRPFGGPKAEEIASRSLLIQNKKFYIDVRKNHRGKFIKMAEVAPTGQKIRIIMDMKTAKEFADKLSDFCDFYSTLGPEKSNTRSQGPDDGKLKSDSIFCEDRRYYMDLKENFRGRFLKFSMALSTTRERMQMVIPAQGMMDLCSCLVELLTENDGPRDSTSESTSVPAAKANSSSVLESEGTKFTCDIEDGRRGKTIRISEVCNTFRAAVTIPLHLWNEFSQMVDHAISAEQSDNDNNMQN